MDHGLSKVASSGGIPNCQALSSRTSSYAFHTDSDDQYSSELFIKKINIYADLHFDEIIFEYSTC